LSTRYVASADGLPNNDVYDFLTLSNGEFWIGTLAGIARYPSISATKSSEIVTELTGLPHPQVRRMVEHNGKVYVGTWGGGIAIYDVTAGMWSQIRPSTTGLTDGFIAGVASSPTEDRVYFATNDGVFIYNPVAGTFAHFSTVHDLPPDDLETGPNQQVVSAVAVTDLAGLVQRWYGPRVEIRLADAQQYLHGITISKPSTTYYYTKDNSGLAEPNVNDIYYDAVRGTYFVAYVSKGISEVDVDNRTWKNFTLVDGLPSNTVFSVTRAGDGNGGSTLWAATQDGVARLSGSKWQGYNTGGGLPADRVRRVYSDDGVRLWAGFINAGASRIKL
jgi:ligand-binding sensor domain-containing protein